jgi:hypothetical protein
MPKRRYQLLLDVSKKDNTLSWDNIVNNLNSKQSAFEFDITRAPHIGRQLAQLPDEADLLEALRKSTSVSNGSVPILVSSAAFNSIEFGVQGGPREGMILSIAKLGSRPSLARIRAFLCLYLADYIARSYAKTLVHDPPQGCMSDAHQTVAELKVSLDAMAICKVCQRALDQALDAGTLARRHRDAIRAILDVGSGRKYCFVLMPFATKFDAVMREGFAKFGGDAWSVQRADHRVEHKNLMDEVKAGIERADLIIADLTGSNANVFYEVGYADAKGKVVVLVTQELAAIPFDLRGDRAHEYRKSPVGLRALRKLLDRNYSSTA